ncbi:hypothetical protein KUTeg_015996 [Tegillarca granosa]|uniref:TIR domain-containing protein n=1 Tax=Tegillarca granosa TaxID=220873 RepID=A0ABQ9EJK8_TEGGR|nr:hypothetical protein KUTeg_015996 [Tegillarca granosa]
MESPSNQLRHKKHVFTLSKDQKYHLFASYCTKDQQVVNGFLSALENIGLKINNPERDFVPGEPILRKHCGNPWCCFEADLAVWKYVTSKGKYRVIPIVLESCIVPPENKSPELYPYMEV